MTVKNSCNKYMIFLAKSVKSKCLIQQLSLKEGYCKNEADRAAPCFACSSSLLVTHYQALNEKESSHIKFIFQHALMLIKLQSEHRHKHLWQKRKLKNS